MRFLLIGDTHFTGKNPVARMDFLPDAQTAKLDELADLIKKENIGSVLLAGDVFDYPYQSYPILVKVWKWFLFFKYSGCWPFAVYGQHDLWNHNIESRASTALGALEAMGVVNILNAKPFVIEAEDQPIHMYGASYGEDIPEIKDTSTINILIIHKTIVPTKPWPTAEEGKDYVTPKILYKKDWFDLVLCGDWHGQFHWQSKAGTHILNPGALVRKTAGKEDYDRHPTVLVWDTETNDIEEILLESAKPSEEVLNKAHLEAVLKKTGRIKEFTDKLKTGGKALGPSYIKNIVLKLQEMEKNKDISTEIKNKILEAIDFSIYKDLINQDLRSVYNESRKNKRIRKDAKKGKRPRRKSKHLKGRIKII